MLDEFASLGKMESLEHSLAHCAGYGVKAYLVVQDLGAALFSLRARRVDCGQLPHPRGVRAQQRADRGAPFENDGQDDGGREDRGRPSPAQNGAWSGVAHGG